MYLLVISYLLGAYFFYSLSKEDYKERKKEYRLTGVEILLIILWPIIIIIALFSAIKGMLKGEL